MAYTVDIVNAAGTYTFQVTPFFEPSVEFIWNEKRNPRQLMAIRETWRLRDAAYLSSTPASVTTEWSTVLTKLSDRSQPVTGVYFKRDGSTVFSMTDSTYLLTVRSASPAVAGGTWQNHLIFTVEIEGLREYTATETALDDDETQVTGIVDLEYSISYEYDRSGLLVKTLQGRVKTQAGTSAQTKAEAFGLVAPSSVYGYLQGNDAHVNVRVENNEDTEATFTSAVQEYGMDLPAGVEELSYTVALTAGAAGITRRAESVSCRGATTAAALKSAARGVCSPATFIDTDETHTDETGLSATANVVSFELAPVDLLSGGVLPRGVLGASSLRSYQGGFRPVQAFPIPGAKPMIQRGAARALTVTDTLAFEVPFRYAVEQPIQVVDLFCSWVAGAFLPEGVPGGVEGGHEVREGGSNYGIVSLTVSLVQTHAEAPPLSPFVAFDAWR